MKTPKAQVFSFHVECQHCCNVTLMKVTIIGQYKSYFNTLLFSIMRISLCKLNDIQIMFCTIKLSSVMCFIFSSWHYSVMKVFMVLLLKKMGGKRSWKIASRNLNIDGNGTRVRIGG